MTYSTTWDAPAISAAAEFLTDDPDGLQQVFDAVDQLAEDPRPDGTTEYGSPDLRRLRVGRYRVVYEIFEDSAEIKVAHLGRVG